MKSLIITIAGKKQVGKNTTGDYIVGLYNENVVDVTAPIFDFTTGSYTQQWDFGFSGGIMCSSEVEFGSFAKALKHHCISLGYVTYAQCFDSDDDKNSLSQCWKGDRQLTAREVLQEVGQFHRNLNPDCWIEALENSIDLEPDMLVITDGRYPNELQWTKDNGGKVIYLVSNADTGNHPSEKSLSLENHKHLMDLVVPGKGLMDVVEREKIIAPVVLGWFKEYGLLGDNQ